MSATFQALEAFLRLALPLTTQTSEAFLRITFPAVLFAVAELRLRLQRSAAVAEHDGGIDGHSSPPPARGTEEVLALGDLLPCLAVTGISTCEGRQQVPHLFLPRVRIRTSSAR